MLSVVLLIVLYSFSAAVVGTNLTYIVKQDDDFIHPSCIAEELERYTAIGWIYPVPDSVEKLPNISKYC